MNPSFRRRDLLKAGVVAGALSAVPLFITCAADAARTPQPSADPWRGLKIGVATCSLRLLPTETAIAAIKRGGVKYVSIKGSYTKKTAEIQFPASRNPSDMCAAFRAACLQWLGRAGA